MPLPRGGTEIIAVTNNNQEKHNMNKAELIAAVAEQAGITKTQASKAIDAITDNIAAALHKGESVTLVGFGTFDAKKRAARTGRNPKTGEAVEIPERRTPSFKPGKGLKDAVA